MNTEIEEDEKATELRAEFVTAVQALAKHWDSLPIPNCEKLDGVAFSILALLDNLNCGVKAKYQLSDNGCQINGRLHEWYDKAVVPQTYYYNFIQCVKTLVRCSCGTDAMTYSILVQFESCQLYADGILLSDLALEYWRDTHPIPALLKSAGNYRE
jgi:hypothetical protein